MINMKKKIFSLLLAFGIIAGIQTASAESEERQVGVFTEISLRIPATLYVEQGKEQKVTVEADRATLEQVITEVSGRALVVRFPSKSYLSRNFRPGRITIRVTMPEVTALNLSGSGNIVGKEPLSSVFLELSVSGSGNIDLSELAARRVKASVSGSGNILIEGDEKGEELTASISGSGNLKAGDFEAQAVKVTIAGSGNGWVNSNDHIQVKIAGSGNLYYHGNPNIDSSIAGSGKVSGMD